MSDFTKDTNVPTNDCISRQAAIDEIKEIYEWHDNVTKERIIEHFKQLPSAQPERPFEIQDILDYLDTVLHPIVSPEHWNVYSELHNMISTLPAAERTGRWIIDKEFSNIGRCSFCGDRWGSVDQMNYCPSCGARMDKVEE